MFIKANDKFWKMLNSVNSDSGILRRNDLEIIQWMCRVRPAIGIRVLISGYTSGVISREVAACMIGLTEEQYEVLVHHYQAGDLNRIPGYLKKGVEPRFRRLLTGLTDQQIELLECLMVQDILFPVSHVGTSHPLISDLAVLAVLKLVKTSWHTSRLLRFELDLPMARN